MLIFNLFLLSDLELAVLFNKLTEAFLSVFLRAGGLFGRRLGGLVGERHRHFCFSSFLRCFEARCRGVRRANYVE